MSFLSGLTLLTLSQTVNILILVSYILVILLLLGAILYYLPRPKSGDERILARVIFALSTVASGVHTWYYMIKFLQFSYHNYLASHPPAFGTPSLLTIGSWLESTSLFDEAWRHVCSSPLNWWWSEHICLFTVPWCAFVYIEGVRHRIPHLWLYPLLGQLMAISTATSLFFLALFSSPVLDPPIPRPRLSAQVYLPLLAAVFPVLYTPNLSGDVFMPNLLLLHLLVLIPFLPLPKLFALLGLPDLLPPAEEGSTLAPSTLLALLESLLFLIRSLTLLTLPPLGSWSALPSLLLQTLYAHPAQSSIGFDAVHVSLLLLLYSLLRRGSQPSKAGAYEALSALAGLIAVGPGVVAPLVFSGGLREKKNLKLVQKEVLKVEVAPRRTRSGRSYGDVKS
ncbi:hypothetical protein DACRYDRAFT_102033 [Dacryopinax primogenitus]|uniref:Uncharacterized protein n=1 Tax=Dacryopinax primogenitus (strain DJM 731) TaxID=1858805 RepID=M5FSJ3_DACPD|nr:uncharacterized protein DACRYDRAFT_102033 [Dacryopinax primogenitus]EJT98154.1 hypothetical protein DACRYDRAFT_102033 [Dacryopinax primogenitus]